ncbi:hypothetical protein RHOFW510R12_08240 [Rhodanobacter sp. FW510-R12]|nr:MAG: DUF3606 domain-containing protein [Rhodanobacter sp.]
MAAMEKHIDMDSPLSRAYWCGNFTCSDAELANAVRIMDSTAVGLVGLYLVTRQSESCAIDQLDMPWIDIG